MGIRPCRRLAGLILIAVSLGAATPARAMDRDVRAVLVAGGYGLLAGTALGLVSYPLTRDTRSIFIGTSVGLYLGLIAGIYYINNRDDPGNPLRSYELDLKPGTGLASVAHLPGGAAPPAAILAVECPVVRW